jgi:hypothetical protein
MTKALYVVVLARHARSSSLRSMETVVMQATSVEAAKLLESQAALAAVSGFPAVNFGTDRLTLVGPVAVRQLSENRLGVNVTLEETALRDLIFAVDKGFLTFDEAVEAAHQASAAGGLLLPATEATIASREKDMLEQTAQGEGDPEEDLEMRF